MFTSYNITGKVLKVMQENDYFITIHASDILHLTEYSRVLSLGTYTKCCLIITRQGKEIKTKSSFEEINKLLYT